MKTTLAPGTWISCRMWSNDVYGVIDAGGKTWTVIWPPPGTLVQRCVWKKKGTVLEPRGKPKAYAP